MLWSIVVADRGVKVVFQAEHVGNCNQARTIVCCYNLITDHMVTIISSNCAVIVA